METKRTVDKAAVRSVSTARSPLTARVILLGLLIIPLNALWITENEYVHYTDNTTTQSLFFNAITLLLLLVGLNRLLCRWRPRWALSVPEMTALYLLTVVASNLSGHDQLQILFTTITYVHSHATPGNGWPSKILPYLPDHLVVRDPEALNALMRGHSTLYRWDHITPWLVPLGWWTLFAMLVVWTMLCLTALFRRPWEDERLSYPIVEIPLKVLTQTEMLFRSKLLWGGVAIGAAGQMINLVHALVPSVPGVPIGVQYFRAETFPWSAAGPLPISSFPFAYGLTFLLPTQLGFSCWFFMLLSRVELVSAAMMGYTESGKFPYIQQQGVGAIFGLFLAILWAARAHLARAWRAALGDPQWKAYDANEPMAYRTALLGLCGGMGGMVWFAMAAGMRWHTACLYLGILFIIVLVVARLRAELGLPTFELYQGGADQVLQNVSGTNAWTPSDLTVMSLFFWLSRTHRQFPMQTQVDAMRLGDRTGTSLRAMSWVILGASALGIVAAFWAYLHTVYRVGFESAEFLGPAPRAFGNEPWQKLAGWLSSPRPSDRGSVEAYLFGSLFTLWLMAMGLRFVWWPFHPVGYLVAGSFGLFRLWFPIFLSWLIKVLLLRYGGLRAYRQALPFFIGLLLGEFTAGFLRTCLDLGFGLHLPPGSGIGGL